MLDDGRITDSQGRTIDFKNTIIILTSNLGSGEILEGIDANGNISGDAKSKVRELLKHQFRPEFLNRLDEIIFFRPLSRAETSKIVDLQIKDLQRRLNEKRLNIQLTDAAKDFIVSSGYDPVYGARPLKRFIQDNLETLIARRIIEGGLKPRSTLKIDYDGQKLLLAN